MLFRHVLEYLHQQYYVTISCTWNERLVVGQEATMWTMHHKCKIITSAASKYLTSK